MFMTSFIAMNVHYECTINEWVGYIPGRRTQIKKKQKKYYFILSPGFYRFRNPYYIKTGKVYQINKFYKNIKLFE